MKPALLSVAALLTFQPAGFAAFELVSPTQTAGIFLPASEPESVRLAVEDLVRDTRTITGRTLVVTRRAADCGPSCVVLASVNRPESAALLEQLAPGFGAGLNGKWEAYRVEAVGPRLLIAGSDERGTIFGLYAFIEKNLGVDPLYFWKSQPPQPRAVLTWGSVKLTSGGPKFRYRGWFINDEDLLTQFGTSAGPRHIDYPFYAQVIDLAMAERIYEALLRLGGNLIIPASFCDVMNPPEAELVRRAVARGLHVTQHHVEPMGVSHFGFENYWRARGQTKAFSHATDAEAVRTVWRDYAAKWRELAGDQVIWQLGMRGRGDRPIWNNDKAITPATAGAFISKAMADQAAIVRSVDPRPQPPMTTTLWAEGADLMASGALQFPAGITVVFSDYGPSQELQRDFATAARRPEYRYGVYYHAAFWRRGPHLVQGVAPERVAGVFRQLEARGDTDYAIINVANVREHVLGAHVFIRTAWHGAGRPLGETLDEFAPAATRPFMAAFHAALVKRSDGVWQQDGDCVEAAEVYLRAKTRADGAAAVRRLVDPVVTERAAGSFDLIAKGGDLAAVPEHWRGWTRDYYIIQGEYLAALYRTVAALARDQPAEAVRQLERSLEIRAPLATGPWAGWYAGDKKANWPDVLRRLRLKAEAK